MKNTDEQGETKSAPKEIEKMTTNRCAKCGLAAVAPIVVGSSCSNAIACAKRRRRSERAAAKRQAASDEADYG